MLINLYGIQVPMWEFLKKGGPRDPKGYRGIIRGLYKAPLRGYIGGLLRNTHVYEVLELLLSAASP